MARQFLALEEPGLLAPEEPGLLAPEEPGLLASEEPGLLAPEEPGLLAPEEPGRVARAARPWKDRRKDSEPRRGDIERERRSLPLLRSYRSSGRVLQELALLATRPCPSGAILLTIPIQL
jgi:hypothetical protein